MAHRLSGQRGLSLIEATIILMLLATLTAVLAPSISGFVDDAKRVKGKEDCEAIGVSIARLLHDTAAPFLLANGHAAIGLRYFMANRVDLLVSDGNLPANDAFIPGPVTNTGNIATSPTWVSVFPGVGVGSMYDHLSANNVGYLAPGSALNTLDPGLPTSLGEWGLGWRGAYLNGIIGPDPWGNRYAVNTVYLGAATDAITSGALNEGERGSGWSFDTFCISAALDGRIEANFEDTITDSVGGGTSLDNGTVNDDIIFVISGFGR